MEKYFIISDIHGSYYYLKQAMDIFEKSNSSKLIILGDILYHGARNSLPEGYNTKECFELLNKYTEKIIAVRGNCDSEVDQMVLDFNIKDDYKILEYYNYKIILSHGHLDLSNIIKSGNVLIQGHTHLKTISNELDYTILNPGSLSIPKDDNNHTFAILENGVFSIYNLNEDLISSYDLINNK